MRQIFALILAVVLGVSLIAPSTAPAIAKGKGSFFDLFFKDLLKPPQEKKEPPKKIIKKKRSKRKKSATLRAPVVKAVDKNAEASRLYVFGDSMGVNLAKALERVYAEDANLVVVNAAKGSSGFVRDDYYDWNKAVNDYIANEKISMAVISIGVNDRQPIKVGGREHKALGDVWKGEYRDRLSGFLRSLRNANIPVIWVGLPPMRASRYSNAMTQISSLHRSAAFSGKAEFVDIFERFIDEDGNFSSYGPDLKGANVAMRASDGIHFTRAGNAKVAFFVEKAIRQFYSGGAFSVAAIDPLAGTIAADMIRPPYQGMGQGQLLEVAGVIIALDQPLRDPGSLVIAGKSAKPVFSLETLMEVPAGRADGFYPVRVEAELSHDQAQDPANENSTLSEQEVSSLN